jgi:hypothetical protein
MLVQRYGAEQPPLRPWFGNIKMASSPLKTLKGSPFIPAAMSRASWHEFMNMEHADTKLLVDEAIKEHGKIRKILSLLYDEDMTRRFTAARALGERCD